MRLLASLGAAVVLLASPPASAREFDAALINALQPGVTTQEDTLASFGEPDTRATDPNDLTIFLYHYQVVPPGGTIPMPIYVVLVFDVDGKFLFYQVHRRE